MVESVWTRFDLNQTAAACVLHYESQDSANILGLSSFIFGLILHIF